MGSVIATVLSVLGGLLVLTGFIALFLWARRTEREVDLPTTSQLSESEANTLRLGIALSANQQTSGF